MRIRIIEGKDGFCDIGGKNGSVSEKKNREG